MNPTEPLPAESFAFALRAHRERLNLTQDAASRLCGVPLRTWARWEAAGAVPSLPAQQYCLSTLKHHHPNH